MFCDYLTVPLVGMQCVIVVFLHYTHFFNLGSCTVNHKCNFTANNLVAAALPPIDCNDPENRYSNNSLVSLDFSLTVKAAPHECVIRTSQP